MHPHDPQRPAPAWGAQSPQQPKKHHPAKVAGLGCGGLLVLLFVIGLIGSIVDPVEKDDTEARPEPVAAGSSPAPVETETKEPTPTEPEPTDDEVAPATLPDFVGKGAKTARQALPSNASILVEDATGQDRIVFVESNWKVCGQDPAAGTKLDGQPVTLEAVKVEKTCP